MTSSLLVDSPLLLFFIYDTQLIIFNSRTNTYNGWRPILNEYQFLVLLMTLFQVTAMYYVLVTWFIKGWSQDAICYLLFNAVESLQMYNNQMNDIVPENVSISMLIKNYTDLKSRDCTLPFIFLKIYFNVMMHRDMPMSLLFLCCINLFIVV